MIKSYILLEISIGSYSLALPLLLGWGEAFYVGFYHAYQPDLLISNGLRLFLAFLLLVVPATLMGATLPVMSRYLIRMKSRIHLTISRLYALNTLGALVGTVLTGYCLLPLAGVRLTILIAVGINFFIAGMFWLVNLFIKAANRSPCSITVRSSEKDSPITPVQKSILVGFCLSGVAAMFYEVAWTRTLSMILGTTTFAFTTMLAAFLLVIALGSAMYGLVRRQSTPRGRPPR